MVPAFLRDEQAADLSGDLPQQRLQLREHHLDRVEIRAVPRQEREPGPMLSRTFAAFALPWAARLSRMTMSPSCSVGARILST